MKYLIASGFIQLTFGLKRYRLRNFTNIHVLKNPYDHNNEGILLHGLTDPKNASIHLVWKITERGFKIADDAMNLALHEFAHALILDNKERMTFRKFYRNKKLINYLVASKVEIKRIKNNKFSIFREYGATNLMEFFAVSVEVFFEQSERFALNNPLLYEKLCLLLNQDPHKKENPML